MLKHIFLTGFMGAGKTTIGHKLAQKLGSPFVDLDNLIVEAAGKNIQSIFSEDGEKYFRDLETKCLLSLSDDVPTVISTGGGIIGRKINLDFMREYGKTIYLSASWPTLKQRLEGTSSRPLAVSDNNWTVTRDLFVKRCPVYELADVVIKTDHRSVEDIIDEIENHV